MNNIIDSVTLHVSDIAAAQAFYDRSFGLGERLCFRLADGQTDAQPSGFRGYTLSLVAAQPADVHALTDAAITAGATVIKPVAKSLWGVGGTIQAPDGAIWKIATSAKKDTAPAAAAFDEIVLLLGAADVSASKAFYAENGVPVAKSFGRSYVQCDTGAGPVGLGLYKHAALAKDAGVSASGSGSHLLTISGSLGTAEDPDGFAWAPSSLSATV